MQREIEYQARAIKTSSRWTGRDPTDRVTRAAVEEGQVELMEAVRLVPLEDEGGGRAVTTPGVLA